MKNKYADNKYADFVIEVAQNMLKMLTFFFKAAAYIGVWGIPVGVITINLFCWHIPWWVRILIVVFGFVLEAVCITCCDRMDRREAEEARKNEEKESDSEK